MSFIISNFNYYPNHQHFQSEFIYLKISCIQYDLKSVNVCFYPVPHLLGLKCAVLDVKFPFQIQNLPKDEEGQISSNTFEVKPSELFDHIVSCNFSQFNLHLVNFFLTPNSRIYCSSYSLCILCEVT